MVDAIGLETDFTLETNRKRMKETLLKSTLRLRKQAIFFTPFLKAPEFHLSDHDFQTMQIQTIRHSLTCHNSYWPHLQNIVLLVFDTGLVFPRIWALQATFEAVLSAVDMT